MSCCVSMGPREGTSTMTCPLIGWYNWIRRCEYHHISVGGVRILKCHVQKVFVLFWRSSFLSFDLGAPPFLADIRPPLPNMPMTSLSGKATKYFEIVAIAKRLPLLMLFWTASLHFYTHSPPFILREICLENSII